MLVIVASDILDGRLARKLGTANARGAAIDTLCDFAALAAAMIVLGAGDRRMILVLMLMLAAFGSWVVSSFIIGPMCYSRIGKYNGAACYALAVVGSARPFLSAIPQLLLEWAVLAAAVAVLSASTVENLIDCRKRRDVNFN
jgi:phosphatidylglycerophosphate synthase